MTDTPIRVVQWTTGNISWEAVKGILERPDLELVGAYAFSADKVGRISASCAVSTAHSA